MIEPFTVRVERLEGSTRSPIPLPPSPSTGMTSPCTSPVTGWTAADVSGLEQWLLTEWSGGGFYSISIVDANNTSMEWEANFDPGKYPKMVPPPLRSGANAQVTSGPPAAATVAPAPSPMEAAGFYPAHVYGPVNYPPLPALPQGVSNMYRPWYPPTPIYQAPAPNGASARDRERELETETKATKAALDEALRTIERMRFDSEIQRRDMETRSEKLLRDIESKYQGQITDLRGGFDKQVSHLETEMREMRRAAEKPAIDVDAKIESMFERMIKPLLGNKDDDRVKRLEDELRRSNEARERDAREGALREEIRRMEERTATMMRELKDAQKDRGPDPILQMMQTSMQTQMEALRQVSQQQQLSMQQLTQFMMPPQAIAGIMRDASNGSDQLMKNVMGAFSSMFDLFREGVANVLQLSGGGESPVMRVIENGLQRLDGLGKDYMKGQRDVEVAKARVQQSYIEAQAEMVKAQATAQSVQQQPGPQQQAQIPANGAPLPSNNAGAVPAQPEIEVSKRSGRTDLQWFGGATERVLELRQAAGAYVEATKTRPFRRNEEGEIPGASPKDAARFLMEAAHYIVANKIDLEAMPAFRLFLQERYAELLDLLVPDVPQSYRDSVVKYLTTALPAGLEDDEEDQEDDEDEDDGNEHEVQTTKPGPAVTQPVVPAPPRQAPAPMAAVPGEPVNARPAAVPKPAPRPVVGTRRPVA